MFENKKILILGMARSGYNAAKKLASLNKVIVNDFNENQDEEKVNELKKLGVEVVLGSHPDSLLDSSVDYIIKNPGINDKHKYIVYANLNNIKVINEMELAYLMFPKGVKIIGVTGSNGKSTTVTLINEILKKKYNDVYLVGNIGNPISSLIGNVKSGDILVTEISSHQLVNMCNFKADIAVVTNFFETHIDFFGDYNNYINTKLKIFNNQGNDDFSILNFDNKKVMEYSDIPNSQKLFFSSTKKKDIYIENKSIVYKNEKIINIDEIFLKGIHNYENVMVAILVSKLLNVSNEDIVSVLKKFKGVKHRLEYVDSINGRKFYNDSKSTNTKACQIALSSFKSPTILLLGGKNSGQKYELLKDYLKNIKFVVCYGEVKNNIEKIMNSFGVKSYVCEDLNEAISIGYKNSLENDIILLSPSSQSWDQYKSFEHRGDHFVELVNKLKGDDKYEN